jgi:hypothetical protein
MYRRDRQALFSAASYLRSIVNVLSSLLLYASDAVVALSATSSRSGHCIAGRWSQYSLWRTQKKLCQGDLQA